MNMDKGVIIVVLVVLVLVGVAIGTNIAYPGTPSIYVEPAVVKVTEPTQTGAIVSLLSVDTGVYLAYAGMGESNTTFYIVPITHGDSLNLGKVLYTLHKKCGDGKIASYGDNVYFAMETENESTVLVTFEREGTTFKFIGEQYIYDNYPINVFANENGVYLLTGKVKTDTVKLLNIETGRTIYTTQAEMVYASYLINYGNKEFLTLYSETNTSHTVCIVEFAATAAPKEIFSVTSHLSSVFAMKVGDEEYIYMTGTSTTLCKIKLTTLTTEKYNIGGAMGIYYSPSQKMFIGLKGRDYMVSTDGIHFKSFFYSKNGYVILMGPGSVIINGNHCYALKFRTNVGLYIMDFDLTGVREF